MDNLTVRAVACPLIIHKLSQTNTRTHTRTHTEHTQTHTEVKPLLSDIG